MCIAILAGGNVRQVWASTDDPYWDDVWYLDEMDIESVWELVKSVPHEKVKLAVLDSGIQPDHPELANVVDMSISVDVTKDGYPQLTHDCVPKGHGTGVAGVIAAEAGNGIGIAGVASLGDNSLVDVFAVKAVYDSDPEGNYPNEIARGIDWAIDNGAQIINVSMASWDSSDYLDQAIQRAYESNVVIVACSGNWCYNTMKYPAGYPTVIQVGAVDKYKNYWEGSNYNNELDIAAFGKDILVLNPRSGYLDDWGSSFASGVVSSVIAMMLSINPNLTCDEIYSIITKTAEDIDEAGWDRYTGYGLIDAKRCVAWAIAKKYSPVREDESFFGSRLWPLLPERKNARMMPAYKVPDYDGDGFITGYDFMAMLVETVA